MIDAKDCPHDNTEWYDITTVSLAGRGKNQKICVRLGCLEECTHVVTREGLPFYDPTGDKLNGQVRVTGGRKARRFSSKGGLKT